MAQPVKRNKAVNAPVFTPMQQLARRTVDDNPQQFEDLLIYRLLRDPQLFAQLAGTLCINKDTQEFVDEFSRPEDNVIYRAIISHWSSRDKKTEAKPPSRAVVSLTAASCASRAESISTDEVDATVERYDELMEMPPMNMPLEFIQAGVAHWMAKSRIQRAYMSKTNIEAWVPEEIANEVLNALASSRVDNEETQFKFGHGIRQKRAKMERVPLGMSNLDRLMIGGVGKGESALFVAGQGVGKTVFGCQFAGSIAMSRRYVLLITTEQPQFELEPRIVSNLGNIQFKRIADGVDMDDLQMPERQRVEKVITDLNEYLLIDDWRKSKKSERSITTSLDAAIESAAEKFGRTPDAVVFDWLGGGLGDIPQELLPQMRHFYKRAADALVNAAEVHKLAMITFAQAHVTKAYNNMRVDASCITEAKNIGERFTWGIGVTGFRESGDEQDAASKPTYTSRQWLYIFKGRKSEGGFASWKRDFGFQRATPI